jgi:hypothetical protein
MQHIGTVQSVPSHIPLSRLTTLYVLGVEQECASKLDRIDGKDGWLFITTTKLGVVPLTGSLSHGEDGWLGVGRSHTPPLPEEPAIHRLRTTRREGLLVDASGIQDGYEEGHPLRHCPFT